ncbi:hypothetical protein GQ53DRAFT_642227, partial [Thozetella sp. PMI_491]
LLTTGIAYAFIGIKTQWVYSFFSAAYLAALGTTVLIVYIVPLPVSDGVQGGLVVAAVCTGLLFGGIAVVFKDIAECLGCLLGGFCFSMWLLTLRAGGLLPDTGAKAVLIAVFTVFTFALYFSHWTRSYAQISSGSFAGATAAVLGIDCFSRAGLKEFWAYVWALNDNIFPLGTVTYPLTRGIRVELAATIIVFVLGIVSQLRVWRIIQEHRAKKEAIKADEEQKKETEEEHIGRQIVEANERDLRNWEHVYGDGPRCPPTADSGVADMESEKRMRHSGGSTSTTGPGLNEAESQAEGQRELEPVELPGAPESQIPPPPPPKPVAPAMVISRDASNGTVTVLVAEDDVPNGLVYDSVPGGTGKEVVWGPEDSRHGSENTTASSNKEKRISKVVVPPPCVTPLPFRVPEDLEDDGYREDRSSVATFADEKEEGSVTAHVERRQSLAKRLSSGSAELLRRLSQKSKGSKGNAIELSEQPSPSREELVESRQSLRDDNDSVAANLDDLSSNGDVETIRDADETRSIEITAELDDKENPPLEREGSPEATKTPGDAEDNETNATNPRSLETGAQEDEPATPKPAASLVGKDDGPAASPSEPGSAKGSTEKSIRGPKSTVSLESTPASLTKGNLPRPLSRVALSYRTNEWAKHLSVAETPAPEILTLHEYPEAEEPVETSAVEKEAPAPVNVTELQQTAENATPAPAAPRSASVIANYAMAQAAFAQRNSSASAATPSPEPQGRNVSPPGPPLTHQNKAYRSKSGTLKRRTSALQAQAIAEETTNGANSAAYGMEESSSSRSNSVPPSPTAPEFSASASQASMRAPVPGLVSYNSPQTLLGQRDVFLRNKSRTSFIPPTPDPHAAALAAYAMNQAGYDNAGSVYNDPASTPARSSPVDMDDLPMSQRRQLMMRQMSHSSLVSGSRPASGLSHAPAVVIPSRSADNAVFDSHQPQRDWSHIKSGDSREAQLRDFRNSVAVDLRTGMQPQPSSGGVSRPTVSGRVSAIGFLAGQGDTSILQGVEHSYSTLMGQKETEAIARELARQDRERSESQFQQRMRADPSFQEAHRDAMRRLQGRAKE